MQLDGKTIALLIAPRGTEDPELAQPRRAVTEAGAAVTVIGLVAGEARTNNHDLDPGETYAVDLAIGDADAGNYDALVIPGGCVGADKLRASAEVVAFVKAFVAASKPVAAICHAPWTLIEAGAVAGRTLTPFPSLRTDLTNAGATWVDEEVVVDGKLVTSRKPDDLPAFCAKLIELVGGTPAAA